MTSGQSKNGLSKKLMELDLPQLVLIKDLVLGEPYREDPEFISGDFIDSSDNYYNLKRLIPEPDYPSNEEAKELFKYKFGEDHQIGQFTDYPVDLNSDLPDKMIFGCSYTILWAVPADLARVVSHLVAMIKVGVGQDVVTEKYLDRMIVFPPGCLDNQADFELGFNFQVQEVFYSKI